MKKFIARGFTLIELLVVIAIIGILSSVILTSLNSARQKARDSRRITDIKQIQLSLELYADNHGGLYPPNTASLQTAGYLQSVPHDPSDNSEYFYATPSDFKGFHLGARLENAGTGVSSPLSNDSDFNSATASGWIGGFDGTDPVYDIKYP